MIISKEQALQILKERGINDPNEPSAIDTRTGKLIPESSFYGTFGERADYDFEQLTAWLGY